MPPESCVDTEEIEYRCPYREICEAKANCFVVATPQPLQKSDILNVRCRLRGGKKIPVYAYVARMWNLTE